MVTEHLRHIARDLELLGQAKIKLAQTVAGKKLSLKEERALYATAIRDQFGLIFSICPQYKFHELYNALQMEEMYSDENVYYTGIELGRTPTEEELISHYMSSDRPKKFELLFKQIIVDEDEDDVIIKKANIKETL